MSLHRKRSAKSGDETSVVTTPFKRVPTNALTILDTQLSVIGFNRIIASQICDNYRGEVCKQSLEHLQWEAIDYWQLSYLRLKQKAKHAIHFYPANSFLRSPLRFWSGAQ